MIIDFHTHVFPETIARKTIEKLEEMSTHSNANVKAFTDGTLDGLKRSMAKNGVDVSVVLPVMTKPEQFDTVNDYAARINGKDGIYSFGGIHPKCSDPEEKLDKIKAMGLKGVKLHPDYQETLITDPSYMRILKHCVKIGLYATVHSGVDIGFPETVHCSAQAAKEMIDKLYDGKADAEARIILAHLGAYEQWADVENLIVGKPVYLDLAFTMQHAPKDQIKRIIQKHGADRILFATDSPWSDQGKDIATFSALGLSENEEKKIKYENGCKILGISER